MPKVRFEGFSQHWELKCLGDLCVITTGKLDANAMVENGDYDFYTSGIKKYKIDVPAFEGPAITVAGNGATAGYMHLADGLFNAYQRTYVLTNFLANREFLYQVIGNELPRTINQEARKGNIPYIVMNMLTNLKIFIPKNEEQQKIGEFFKQLDDRIALQQRHVEQLKQSKQGFLQKMFPKDGESVPEVRFDEYYNQWTNVRFGDITDFTTGTSKTKDINSKGKYFVMDMGSVSNTGQNIAHKKVKSSDGLLCSGDLIMPKDDIGGGFIIGRTAYIDQDNKYVLGDHVYKLSVNPEKVNSLYLHFYINTPQINIQFKRLVTGSAQLGIRSIYLCDESILIPSISEQQKIGEFFKQLDDLIAKNERELELLQETKKGFLQKMFV